MNSFGFQKLAARGLVIWLVGIAAMWVPATPLLAAEDPYLQALESEIDKVEPNEIGADLPDLAPSEESVKETALVRERFESMLQQRYAGTFSFYARLPERSRQEILGEYRKGADIAQLRQMIIDRFYGSK